MKTKILFSLAAAGWFAAVSANTAELRIGIVGCDTSHVPAFAEIFNDPKAEGFVPGGKVVAAFKGGSADFPQSASRVDAFAKKLQEKFAVKFYDSIPALCSNVDAVLLESVDGRSHLEQARQIIAARKPLFIDKPMAASLADVMEIFRLAKAANVPIWSASSLRFGKDSQAVHDGKIGEVKRAVTYSPLELGAHHPELFFYGIHGVESLFTVMGTGCESVQRRTETNGAVEVVGTWRGGRTGIYRQDLAKKYHGTAEGEKGGAAVGSYDGYAPLAAEIMKFFQTGNAPVKPEETIEIFAFMAAAQASKEKGGAVVRLDEVMPKAHQQSAKLDSGKYLAHEN
jgi:Oxidoreductase family, NAD-binding Rossmann fold